jgi:predicted lipid-binding transport protein (Tim44 family)
MGWLVILGLLGEALARAGGGHGYSGGGSSGGGSYGGGGGFSFGGGSSDGDGGALLWWLLFEHPAIGVPVVLVVAAIWIWQANQKFNDSQRRVYRRGAPIPPPQRASLKERDPGFSEPLFLDLARLVFVRGHEERGRGNDEVLEAWLSEGARRMLANLATPVRDVIIGATSVTDIEIDGNVARILVRFDANITEGHRKKIVRERWTFQRLADARSPGPERMRALNCVNCGSPAERLTDGRCQNCNTVLVDARVQWRATSMIRESERVVVGVELHLGGGVEVGTDLPTVRAPDATAQLRAISARDPSFSWNDFRRHAIEVFGKIQSAWGEMKWEQARPYETDFLFQQHRYWIDRYREEGYRNRIDDAVVTGVDLARVSIDAHIESITVRIYARMLDWTEDKNGKVVGGSDTDPKIFSEYWTFVRTAGRGHKPVSSTNCPNCGAPLDRVSETGVCGYCEAKITGGDFDWVLSAIDQDEEYR